MPWVVGRARHTAAFGTPAQRSRQQFRIVSNASGDGWILNAGTTQGLTPDTVLEVLSGSGPNPEVIRHVRVIKAGDSSAVEPITFNSNELPETAICKPVVVEYRHLTPPARDHTTRGPTLVALAGLQQARDGCPANVEFRLEAETGDISKPGSKCAFRVTNTGESDIRVGLMLIDPQQEIFCVPFPEAAGTNATGRMCAPPIRLVRAEPVGQTVSEVLLRPGKQAVSESITLPAIEGQYFVVGVGAASDAGSYRFVESSLSAASLTKDEQQHITQARATPLGKLLSTLLDGNGDTTGLWPRN